MTQFKDNRARVKGVSARKQKGLVLPQIDTKTTKSKKKQPKKDTQKIEAERMWRSKPAKIEPAPPKEIYTFEFSLSEAITTHTRSTLCHHLQDSMTSHVIEFEPLSKRVLNTCCELCDGTEGRGRAESCPPTTFPASKPRLMFPKLERLRSRSIDIGVLSNKPKEILRLPPIASPWK